VARGPEAFVSAHLGDLDSELAYRAFATDLELYLAMLGVRPDVVAHDLHPEYLATKWALEQDAELVGVQHHHAHAAACLAEHGEVGPALALVFDGTGYGTDGTLWGGELLRCDLTSVERVAYLEPVPRRGGGASARRRLRRHVPEPAPAGFDATAARGAWLSGPHAPPRAAQRRRHQLRPGGRGGRSARRALRPVTCRDCVPTSKRTLSP